MRLLHRISLLLILPLAALLVGAGGGCSRTCNDVGVTCNAGFACNPATGECVAGSDGGPPVDLEDGTPGPDADLGGVPDMASCVPPPAGPQETIASGQGSPIGIGIDETFVYWTNHGDTSPAQSNGALWRAPVGGGKADSLTEGQPNPVGLRVHGSTLFFVNANLATAGAGDVQTADLVSSILVTVAKGLASPVSIDFDERFAYWANYASGEVVRHDVKENQTTVLSGDNQGPTAVAVADGDVFWLTETSDEPRAQLRVSREAGGPVETLADGPPSPGSGVQLLALDETYVYAAIRGERCDQGEGVILRVARDGSETVELAGGQACPRGLAIDDRAVYWTNAGTGPNTGSVNAVCKTGGKAVELASDQNEPYSIAVSPGSIYWVNFGVGAGDGTVMALRR